MFGQEYTIFYIYHMDARVQRRTYQAHVCANTYYMCRTYVRCMCVCVCVIGVYVSVCGEIDRNLYNRSCVEIDTYTRERGRARPFITHV